MHAVTLAFFMSIGLLVACGDGDSNSNTAYRPTAPNARQNEPRTNAEELGMLIKMPYETEDIVWKEFPNSNRIVAAIRFTTANANKIVAESGGTPEGATVPVEPWFPDELIAQSEMSGDRSLKGTAFPATIFYQEPYTVGKVTRIEGTDYFIVDMIGK